MNDPYRIHDEPRPPAATPRPAPPGATLRTVLWLLLVVGLAGDVVVSSTGADPLASIPFGVAALGAGIALALQHYRNRTR